MSDDRVLSTLNQDGTRNVLDPKLAHGRFLDRRRVVGYALIVLFVVLPRIRIGGRPAVLIDLFTGEISAFGALFRPSEGFLLALLGLSVVAVVFLVTALFGRVWCGWGCPQTVYLELVFRPIERLFEGRGAHRKVTPIRRGLKLVVFAGLAFALSNVFLAYFVGTDRLETWVFESPLEHVGGFTVVMVVTGLVLFDFGYFREQMCIVACPYGRLQSVLLDRQSLIVGYDTQRGEPRMHVKKSLPVVGGACVDCSACVATCPTGIDIRDGLQMECIGCAQCIDACDAVMDNLHRPRGLIRYTSQDELAGQPRRLLRVRTVVYPALLAVALAGLVFATTTRADTEVWVDRITGPAFVDLPDGKVSSQLRLKIENRSDARQLYTITLVDMPLGELRSPLPVWEANAHKSIDVPLFVDLPRSAFVAGQLHARVRVSHEGGFTKVMGLTLLGPDGGTPR
ncbi:MAG: cytochrome c oxidase accessory protein CcoG [Kofleriaceae bacterium]